MAFRYENRNGYPVTVPDQRGGQVTFAPGKWSCNEWFSRFCGPRKLTKIAASSDLPATSRTPPPPLVYKPLPLKMQLSEAEDEQTMYWVKRRGIFNCSSCLFRTGSQVSMLRHLVVVHNVTEIVTPVTVHTAPKPVQPVKVDEPVRIPVVPNMDGDTTIPSAGAVALGVGPSKLAEAAVSQTVVSALTEKPVYPCPNCDRKYTTSSGLERHLTKDHAPVE